VRAHGEGRCFGRLTAPGPVAAAARHTANTTRTHFQTWREDEALSCGHPGHNKSPPLAWHHGSRRRVGVGERPSTTWHNVKASKLLRHVPCLQGSLCMPLLFFSLTLLINPPSSLTKKGWCRDTLPARPQATVNPHHACFNILPAMKQAAAGVGQ